MQSVAQISVCVCVCRHFPRGTEENLKNLNQGSRFSRRALNRGLPDIQRRRANHLLKPFHD